MLLVPIGGIFIMLIAFVECVDIAKNVKPYTFPVPFELPNRNDRSEQCWLRFEDIEVVETVAVYCYIAHAFLDNYIQDFNLKKMDEDGVKVSRWSEKPRDQEKDILPPNDSENLMKDWRATTVLDPTTKMRLYVPKNADCRLIMYTREGMTNYKVDCERILYYFNVRDSGCVFSQELDIGLLLASIFLVYFYV